MSDFMRNRRQEETDSFFCRFTFGQFFALLVLEVFTLFFVFYLGARYGEEFLGLRAQAEKKVAMESTDISSPPKVPTTDDPNAAKTERELMAQAKTPELKERISQMFEAAKGKNGGKSPPVVEINHTADPSSSSTQERVNPEVTVMTAEGKEEKGEKLTDPLAEAIAEQKGKTESPQKDAGKGAKDPTPVKMAEREMGDDTSGKGASDKSVVRVKSADNGRYSLQIGSYPQMAEATRVLEKWKEKGYSAYMMIADIPERGRWYRVRIGGFGSREDATRYLKDFETREHAEALIVLNEQ